jgi:hypothetical protein
MNYIKLKSKKRGSKSVSVLFYPNGDMVRGDVDLYLATKMSTKDVMETLGITRQEVMNARKEARKLEKSLKEQMAEKIAVRLGVRDALNEDAECPLFRPSDIKDLERFADQLLDKFGIDIEFTKHFGERMGDDRNKPCIKMDELKDLFKKISDDKGKRVKLKGVKEAVLVDMQKKINIPFIIKITPNGDFELTLKTIMRKKGFQTPDKRVVYEELKVSDGVEVWIKDFQDSDAPQFKGKSKEKRREMAVAAYMSAKEKLDEATQQPKTGTLTIVQILSKELAPYLVEMKKRYREGGKQFVSLIEKKLKEHDWDLNKLVPRMKNIHDRKAYIEYQRYKQKIQTVTEPDKDKNPLVLRFDGPYYLQMAPGKIAAFLQQMEKDAEVSFDSYIAKLAEKIGQEIKSADVQGNLWNGSILEVVTLANEVQRWKTQIIINRSKLGLLFNQYPTRRMK